ncbi:MAG: PHP domain-containing protein [Butyrivibrio sp.]|nr:PHP domain-containing protein [Butyrivibrio sp.]
MKYYYETHMHTREASACSGTDARDYIKYMSELGYSGIIITDHFFNGNCCIPKDLPWEKRVEMYCSGYKHALEEARNTNSDLTVMFGIEYNFKGDEFLLYGVDEDWLLANPDLLEKDRHEVYKLVKDYGGMMIQAHPYRERGYLSEINLTPSVCDGVEVYNSGNPDYQNSLAYEYAVERNFRMSSGSDIHNFGQNEMGAMCFDHKINSVEEYVKAFLNNEGTPVFMRGATQNGEFKEVSKDTSLTVPTQRNTLEVIWH